jgi:hypothetical protein
MTVENNKSCFAIIFDLKRKRKNVQSTFQSYCKGLLQEIEEWEAKF